MPKRQCRCCGVDYEYPERKSSATRHFCDPCARIEQNPRRAFELFRKNMRAMEKRIEELEHLQKET